MLLALTHPGMRRSTYLYVVIGVMQACYLPFTTIVFRDRGVPLEAIGVLGAVNSLLALAAGPVWGHLADAVLGRVAAFRLAIAAAATGVGLFALGPAHGIPGAALAAFAGAGLVPLLDAIGMEHLAEHGGDWGPLRATTSGSYALTCIASGALVAGGGALVIGPMYGVGAAAVLLGTMGLRVRGGFAATPSDAVDRRQRREVEERAERNEYPGGNAEIAVAGSWRNRFGTASLAFERSPGLAPFLLLSLFANLGAGLFYAYGSLRIQELARASGGGDGSSYVALAATIAATVEIPFFLAGAAIAARLGLRALYVMGLLGIGICSVIYALSPSAESLVVARGLIGIGYSGMLLASVLSIRAIVPDELQATGQALFQSVSYGLAIAIAALAGGWIYGAIGSAPLFALAALILFACIPLAMRVAAR